VFVRCVIKMYGQKFEQHCAMKFCVKLGVSATVTYEKLQRAYGEHSLSRAQGSRGVWLSHTAIVVLLRSDVGGSLGRALVTLQG
jgi:hypothetical protein